MSLKKPFNIIKLIIVLSARQKMQTTSYCKLTGPSLFMIHQQIPTAVHRILLSSSLEFV